MRKGTCFVALALIVGGLTTVFAACAPATPIATPAPEEQITLEIVWWGSQEVKNMDKWLDECIEMYETEHPGTNIKSNEQTIDVLGTTITAAMEARKGPCIVTPWSGYRTLTHIIAGELVPLDGLVPQEVIDNNLETGAHAFEGKTYSLTTYVMTGVLAWNKELFDQAGLDPDEAPESWDEVLANAEKLKAAGITPFIIGNKAEWVLMDWYGGATLPSFFDTWSEVADLITGQSSWEGPEGLGFLAPFKQMYDGGYLNDDIQSLEEYQGIDGFILGRGAMTFMTETLLATVVDQMGVEKVGIAPVPRPGGGKLSDLIVVGTANGWAIPEYCPHKQEAADFIAFLRTPERNTAFFNMTSAFPGDRRLDYAKSEDPLGFGETRIKWRTSRPGFAYWWDMMSPTILNRGVRRATVGLTTGEITDLHEAAKIIDEEIAAWREGSPEEVEFYEKWHNELADLMPGFKP